MTANRTLVANFTSITHQITTSSSPGNGGSTSGGGTYNAGANVTVTANPASGWQFVNWTENGSQVSANASYSFSASANRTLVANFTSPTCTLTLQQTTGGTLGVTSGSLTGTCGRQVSVQAAATSGYSFTGWSDGTPATTNPYTITLSTDKTLSGTFVVIPATCTLTLSASSGGVAAYLNGTTATGACGRSVTLQASANSGFIFAGWSDGTQANVNPNTLVLTRDLSLQALFVSPGTVVSKLIDVFLGKQSALLQIEMAFADQHGNKNGTVDLGDLVGLLDQFPNAARIAPDVYQQILSSPNATRIKLPVSKGKVP
ncbi:MAG: InlB B-repeat-containing protein [Gemmatimonadaceae bacterium]|nr:InlB B-repeat-containing protein [Gemmatimonadaceae bacterium]